jgi:hypothetical protein
MGRKTVGEKMASARAPVVDYQSVVAGQGVNKLIAQIAIELPDQSGGRLASAFFLQHFAVTVDLTSMH